MADKRSEYVVTINGIDHVFLLTEDDAKNIEGAKKKDGAAKEVAAAAAKATFAMNKALDPSNK